MLDIGFIRENPELVKQAAANKNFKVDVDKIIELDNKIRPLQHELETLQAERNRISKMIASSTPDARAALKNK
ncbi:MAG: hypothetical protein R3B45_15185 [Bdellovibrionota bacterium]